MAGEWQIGSHRFRSRLIVGTGKYPSSEIMRRAVAASGAEMITVAVGRVDLGRRGQGNILDELAGLDLTILPNTAGAYTAKDAIRIARHSSSANRASTAAEPMNPNSSPITVKMKSVCCSGT